MKFTVHSSQFTVGNAVGATLASTAPEEGSIRSWVSCQVWRKAECGQRKAERVGATLASTAPDAGPDHTDVQRRHWRKAESGHRMADAVEAALAAAAAEAGTGRSSILREPAGQGRQPIADCGWVTRPALLTTGVSR